MHTLYFRPDELRLFEVLPDALREGWETEQETGDITDAPPRKIVRLKLLTLHDPQLKDVQARIAGLEDGAAIAEAIASVDLSQVSYDDLAELVFAAGPDVLSLLIVRLLQDVSTDEQMEDIASLCFLRRELLSSRSA